MGLNIEAVRRLGVGVSAIQVKIYESIHPFKTNFTDNKQLTIELGKEIGEKESNWEGGLSVFGSIYNDKGRPDVERVEAAIWAAQMLINLSRPSQAKGILSGASKLMSQEDDTESKVLEARICEKKAWVASIEAKPKKALKLLQKSEKLFNSVGDDLPEDAKKSKATMIHFFGRTYFSLGKIDRAKKYFFDDLNRINKESDAGNPDPASKAFNHAWLARCFAYGEEFGVAHEHANNALDFFNESIEAHILENPSTEASKRLDVLAHYYLVEAEILLVEGRQAEAVVFADKALSTRMEVKPKYPKGAIEALLVLGVSYWQLGKFSNSKIYIDRAIEVYHFLKSSDDAFS